MSTSYLICLIKIVLLNFGAKLSCILKILLVIANILLISVSQRTFKTKKKASYFIKTFSSCPQRKKFSHFVNIKSVNKNVQKHPIKTFFAQKNLPATQYFLKRL